jgi:putative nucleotidyltransferase with HDIG domain
MTQIVKTKEDAIALLTSLSAPLHLVQHHCLVLEAACELVKGLQQLFPQFTFNSELVLIGAALHDVGKTSHHNEIYSPGNRHEQHGETLLLSLGISPEIAKFCRTHAQWSSQDAEVEDWLVALADNLWKGCRKEKLEASLVAKIAQGTGKDFWDIFILVDSLFEKIADRGSERLSRSVL